MRGVSRTFNAILLERLNDCDSITTASANDSVGVVGASVPLLHACMAWKLKKLFHEASSFLTLFQCSIAALKHRLDLLKRIDRTLPEHEGILSP